MSPSGDIYCGNWKLKIESLLVIVSHITWCPYPEAEACVSKLPRQETGDTLPYKPIQLIGDVNKSATYVAKKSKLI